MGSRRRLILGALGALAAPAAERIERVEPVMGTLFRVTLYASRDSPVSTALDAAFARARALDASLSDYDSASELNRLCRAGQAQVSPDLYRLLETAQEIARQSHGAFDVTAGRLIRLWREARRTARLPDPDAIAEAQEHSGWRFLRLDRKRRVATLSRPAMQLDLGGIAKGFAADEMLAVLRQQGIQQALVAASGDIVAGDPPPDRPGWKIAVESPSRTLELARRAVSTSGDSEQFVIIGGQRFSHIIDPRTGQALRNSRTVSVIAPTGMLADAWATANSVIVAAGGIPRNSAAITVLVSG